MHYLLNLIAKLAQIFMEENYMPSNFKVFVTYGWNNETNELVYSFVDLLRKLGFDAECDKTYTEKQATSNFSDIMNNGLLQDKIIVILSSTYKIKAESGSGGVGTEYRIISNDIHKNSNKYILVSFDGTTEDIRNQIVPKLYEGYEIIDIIEDEKKNYEQIVAKLQEKQLICFSNVAKTTPNIETKHPKKFTLNGRQEVCPGYGEFKNTCSKSITFSNRHLCKDCFDSEFKDQILELYKAQGYQVTPCTYDVNAFTAKLCYGFITTIIYVKTFSQYNNEISADELIALENIKSKEFSKTGKKIDQVHIVSVSQVNSITRDIAKRYDFVVMPEEELLQKIMDLSEYFTSVIEKYEKSDLFHHYIELNNISGDSLDDVIDNFIERPDSNSMLFLGDYGCGKTSFCLKTTYQLIKKYKANESPYIPILICLRDFTKSLSIDDLLTNFFINKNNINNGNIKTFNQLLKHRKVVLIFDGFDEIAKRIDYDIKYQVYNVVCYHVSRVDKHPKS